MDRDPQSHGENSKVYVPVLRYVFQKQYQPGATTVGFSLADIREAIAALGLPAANPADVVYRMKSRTKIPPEIQALGFRIIRVVGRGKYVFEQGESTLINVPECETTNVGDRTPPVVRAMLGGGIAEIDEQGLLAVVRYNDLISRFLDARAFHLKGHIRKSIQGVGQAEVDDLHIAIPFGVDVPVTIVPVEAKGHSEPINRVQIVTQVMYARAQFPGHPIRPLVIKALPSGELLFVEFDDEIVPASLAPKRFARYRLVSSI